jgi:N-acetylglucosaminyl-diphospho-decaprenol L-rhamnosyltransferase
VRPLQKTDRIPAGPEAWHDAAPHRRHATRFGDTSLSDAATSETLVTVIVVVHDAGAHLARCLASLEVQSFGAFEAIVCDNASADGAFEAARASTNDPRFRFHAFGSNRGFAAANNRAAEMARGRWLALLNPDAIAAPDWLERLLDAARRHADIDAFASLQLDAADPTRFDGAGDVLSAWGVPWRGGFGQSRLPLPEGECFSACGAAAFYRTERFHTLGGFAEDFFCFCEDVDLGFRHRLAGGRTVFVSDAVVQHWGGASTGRRSDFAIYHGARNRLWTFLRCMPGALLAALLLPHLAATLILLAQAVLRGGRASFLRGIKDAVAELPAILSDRRRIQATRRASLPAIAGALTWSPLAAIRRAPSIRPLASRVAVSERQPAAHT